MENTYKYSIEFNGVIHDADEFKRFAVYDVIYKDGNKICHFEIEYDWSEINDINFVNCEKLLPKEIFSQLEDFVDEQLKYDIIMEDVRDAGEW